MRYDARWFKTCQSDLVRVVAFEDFDQFVLRQRVQHPLAFSRTEVEQQHAGLSDESATVSETRHARGVLARSIANAVTNTAAHQPVLLSQQAAP